MCIRDSVAAAPTRIPGGCRRSTLVAREWRLWLSLIHISEPTRLLSISYAVFCLLMIRRPPRSTRVRSSAASDVYKRQRCGGTHPDPRRVPPFDVGGPGVAPVAVSYTHLRAHETPEHLVCRLLLEKK